MPLWKGPEELRNPPRFPNRPARTNKTILAHYRQGWRILYGTCESLEDIILMSKKTTVRAKGGRNRTSTLRHLGISASFIRKFTESANAAVARAVDRRSEDRADIPPVCFEAVRRSILK